MKNWSTQKKVIVAIVVIGLILLFLYQMKWLGNTTTLFAGGGKVGIDDGRVGRSIVPINQNIITPQFTYPSKCDEVYNRCMSLVGTNDFCNQMRLRCMPVNTADLSKNTNWCGDSALGYCLATHSPHTCGDICRL